jgi:hypothetical protein
MIECERFSLMYFVNIRTRMSAPPPAGNGTIIVIGLEALNCARAVVGNAIAAAPASRKKSRLLI